MNKENTGMKTHALGFGVAAAALIALGACSEKSAGGNGTEQPKAQTPKAAKPAGTKTNAAGRPADSRFMASAKAAGLDQTLAGPGPYTVFVPDDAAFAKAPAGTLDANPRNRAQLTGTLTNLILQGTVMAKDIDTLIDRSKGKALLATTAGGTLTATKEGGKTVLTDSEGHKATITQADEQFTNGVVHRIDAVLMPQAKGGTAPAVGQKAGG
jgi:uncharacterized surface protein with fasciclin (FAS1) repeats